MMVGYEPEPGMPYSVIPEDQLAEWLEKLKLSSSWVGMIVLGVLLAERLVEGEVGGSRRKGSQHVVKHSFLG